MSELLQSGQHPDADQVSAFIDHALRPHEREEMLAHLAACADCRETVALSSPPNDALPVATVKEKRKRWFWGWTVLAPAAAFTAVLLVVHFTAGPHIRKSSRGPVAKLEPPAAPPRSSNTPAAGTQSPKQSVKKSQPVHPPAVKIQQMAAVPMSAEASAQSPNLAGGDLRSLAEAPPIPPTLPAEEKPQMVLRSAAPNQSAVGEKKRLAALRLPGGAAAFSAVARGRQILAIDAGNAVFLSNDDGATWVPIHTPWKSRAIKAEVVSYSTRPVRALRFSANEIEPGGESTDGAAIPTSQPAAPGSLTGTVTDRSGATIPHASVVVLDPAGHATRTAETDASGQYRIDGLVPGTYQLQARARGFKTATIQDVQIVLSAINLTNLTLDVGAATQTVTVEAASPTIETSSPVLSESIDGQASDSAGLPAPAQPAPLFQITTENGDHWTSADGVIWRRR